MKEFYSNRASRLSALTALIDAVTAEAKRGAGKPNSGVNDLRDCMVEKHRLALAVLAAGND